MAKGRFSTDHIVARLVARQLSPLLMGSHGSLPYLPSHISICMRCLPTPGDDLIGYERMVSKTAKGLLIHSDAGCRDIPKGGTRIPLNWVTAPQSSDIEFAEVRIIAQERRMLFDDILHAIPDIPLHAASGRVTPGGGAEFLLVTEGVRRSDLAEARKQLAKVPGVRRVFSAPTAAPQHSAARSLARRSIAFGEHDRHDWLGFYDREEPLREVQAWLHDPQGTNLLLLRGERRIGKTSLLRHLHEHLLPQQRQVVSVFTDLHKLAAYGMTELSNLLLREIYHELKRRPLEQPEGEAPAVWLSRELKRVIDYIHPKRLLLMIDEFSLLHDLQRGGEIDQTLLLNLRSLVAERRDMQ